MTAGPIGQIAMQPRTEPVNHSYCEIPHTAPFLLDLRVETGDMSDTIEHVSNVSYLRWIDRAAELHSDALGFTRRRLLSEGRMWFVARHEIDYLAEVWRDDELVAATWVREVRRVRSWRDTVIFRPGDETIVCRAATLWVLVDIATRKPIPIDQEMRNAIQQVNKSTDQQACRRTQLGVLRAQSRSEC